MKFTFLGTGTSQGIPVIGCECKVCTSQDNNNKRLRTSALVQDGNINLVIDTGPDFRQQMIREDLKHLDGVLMTHYHNDHIAGLDDIRPFNFRQKASMKVFADQDTQTILKQKFSYIFERDPYPGAPSVHLIDHEFSPMNIGQLHIRPFKVWHGKMPITAYQINDLVYITDANAIPESEIEKISNCKVLVLNALRKKEHHSHFNLEQAIELSKSLNAETTYLLHISHYMGLHESVSKELPENVNLAHDGLELDI